MCDEQILRQATLSAQVEAGREQYRLATALSVYTALVENACWQGEALVPPNQILDQLADGAVRAADRLLLRLLKRTAPAD